LGEGLFVPLSAAPGSELILTEASDARCRGDGIEDVFVVVRIDHPNELDKEWVEPELVVATVCAHERDGGCRTRLDAPHVIAERAYFAAQLIEQTPVLDHSRPKLVTELVMAIPIQCAELQRIAR